MEKEKKSKAKMNDKYFWGLEVFIVKKGIQNKAKMGNKDFFEKKVFISKYLFNFGDIINFS